MNKIIGRMGQSLCARNDSYSLSATNFMYFKVTINQPLVPQTKNKQETFKLNLPRVKKIVFLVIFGQLENL